LPNIPYEDVEGDDFGYLGGLNYLKGIHILYQAVERINHNGRRTIQVHATNFPNLSGPFLDTLRNTGFTFYRRLMKKQYNKLYRQVRCVIVPSIWQETFSYTVVEALLRGRLVIASKIGAIPEVVSGCDGALLFSAGSFEQLVEKILYVKDMNRETMVDLGIRSRKAIERRFSNEKTISEFVHLLNIVSDNKS